MELVRKRDRLLRLISSDKPVRLGIPAHTQHRCQYGDGAERKNEFRIMKKKPARLPSQADLRIFLKLKLWFHLFTAPTLHACDYLLSGSAFKSSPGNGDGSQFRETSIGIDRE